MGNKTYDASDAGCYVDGSWGIYAIDKIVSFATGHGYVYDDNPANIPESFADDCQLATDTESEVNDYMESEYPVDGHYWGRDENGNGWGLWAYDSDEDEDNEDEDEMSEDDISTTDFCKFYQYGKLWLECGIDADFKSLVRAKMDSEQFWPSVWFISDHGNAHAVSLTDED